MLSDFVGVLIYVERRDENKWIRNCNSNLDEGKTRLPRNNGWRQIKRQQCKNTQMKCTVQTHKRTWNHTALILIETPFKVDSSWLSVDVENYCSDPTTPCTIKTRACGLGAGIFIPCGNQPYIHTDLQTELNTAKNIFIHMYCVRRNM